MTAIKSFMASIMRMLEDHRASDGGYRRRKTDLPVSDLYGTADAVILMYTLDKLPAEGTTAHAELVQSLQSFQQPDGLFFWKRWIGSGNPGANHSRVRGCTRPSYLREKLIPSGKTGILTGCGRSRTR